MEKMVVITVNQVGIFTTPSKLKFSYIIYSVN